jgi:GT2 family glycosyltransferase
MHELNPINHPICFSRPLRITASLWVKHIPFGMFLIDLLRPKVVVELGTFTGVSYCAFCQAVKELGIDTKCYGIGSWEVDEHNGAHGPDVLDQLKAHHDPLYGSFSHLIQNSLGDASSHFGKQTIDLLHIDGHHAYEAARNDFNNWLPRMSNNGVVLFHDINLRQQDCGVWELWEELKRQYPYFEILHGYGLGLLSVSELPPEPLKLLLNASESDLVHLREFFYRLGSTLEVEQSAREVQGRFAETRETPVRSLELIEDVREKIAPRILEPTAPQGLVSIQVIQNMIARLTLDVSSGAPCRINLLVPTINLKYVFGGYITKFNLARHLAENGYKVRIVIVDQCDFDPELWRRQLQAYPGLEAFVELVELEYAFDRSKPLQVNKDDVFIATTWWTAHIAHRAVEDLGKERFLYLIQEYEPFTFPMGTFASLAGQTYSFKHYAIFSTELLRDYFRQNAIGVFSRSWEAGERDSVSFENAITSVGRMQLEDLANRTRKKFLFYARPEAHATRNMFETAVLALSQAIESGCFSGEWEFNGIGTVETSRNIQLASGISMHVMPRQSQDAYRDVLRNHDLGLSLMHTPHPSLVPIEMASAGMLVVTNTYANKTREALAAISPNIIAVPPTVDDVCHGLRQAVSQIEDYDRRVRGSRVHWSTSWDSAFDRNVTSKVKAFITDIRQSTESIALTDHSAQTEVAYKKEVVITQLPSSSDAHSVPGAETDQEETSWLRKQLVDKEETINTLTQLLAQNESQLRRMTNTIGWRLLSHYGPIKYSYVLPAYNWVRGIFRSSAPQSPGEIHYETWASRSDELRHNPEKAAAKIEQFAYKPTISIVMPVYNVLKEHLSKALDSVLAQYYPFWELCICDDASTEPDVRKVLERYSAREERIKVAFSENNGGIALASNNALQLATGEFIALLDHDDELPPDALYEVVRSLQEVAADLIYSDEDKLDAEGSRCDPFFKPSWSPDLLLSCNYISHFGVYRKSIIDQIGGFRKGYDGSQDYDLVLRFVEHSEKIVHIPKILYHWRKASGSAAASIEAKPYAYEAGKKALADALIRRKIEGEVVTEKAPGFYRVKRKITQAGKVTIIIPTRDRLPLLEKCIESIEQKTDYENYEIVIVNNGSRERATLEYLSQTRHRVIHDSTTFNYSRLNNRAASEADGDYLLLLNNDVEVISGEWLSAMVEHAQRPEVGAVGAKLLYPDNRIQHAGVILGLGGVANHAHRLVDGYLDSGYFGLASRIRNFGAVTAACLMIRRQLFEQMGGLNERKLAVSFNDVDLCLRLRRRGYFIVFTPYALLYHKESASRGYIVDPNEVSYMMSNWRNEILSDPYYNPNLSLKSEDFSIDFSKPESSFCVYSQEISSEIVGQLRRGRKVGQGMKIDQDNLCAIGIRFGTSQTVCEGRIKFHLRQIDHLNDDVSLEVDASSILDNEYHVFVFESIRNSRRTSYYFYVEYSGYESEGPLTIWKSSFNSDAMGPHFENHQPSSGTLSFKVFCEKQFRT